MPPTAHDNVGVRLLPLYPQRRFDVTDYSVVTDRHLFWENRFLYLVSTVLVNIIRSIPFVILLVLLLPLTQFLLGNTIGPVAAAVPMSVAAIAFYARLVDSALREVDPGIVEAAEAFGASPLRIICTVLLPKARAGLLRGG